jgi:hypothetical protein
MENWKMLKCDLKRFSQLLIFSKSIESIENKCLRKIEKNRLKYIPKIHTFVYMKILSLKLDDKIFEDTEELTAKLKLARNRYINEAVNIYNQFNKRKLLKNQLMLESKLVSEDSMDILNEFEQLMDED